MMRGMRMRRTWMMAAACALAACRSDEGETARAAAPADTAPFMVRVDSAAPIVRAGTAADAADYVFRPYGHGRGVTDSIVVLRDGRPVQTLVPGDNEVDPELGIERVARPDLDWDGHVDLGYVTELGMAGSRSVYWRFDPATGRLTPAGTYETLQPDSARREWHTFNRGGHAGRLWTASRWRWMDGKLTEIRREAQDLLDDTTYVRITHERRGGALAETARQPLTEDALRGGPSWMEP
ncbi:hypothetical protein [Longimicrobium sp.]|uniref:hypothetical protein n=1 Tax=Longimicrobium sp. TaxID=2029185 RepID=UPI002E367E37|nr:hypothetical protein [Longimicrobium sp.]HEX6036499.1 hypothetical protein [Longimicrobium sp.]